MLPARASKELNALLKKLEVTTIIVDATERIMNRPKDNEVQKEYYSGKKRLIPSKTPWWVKLIVTEFFKTILVESDLKFNNAIEVLLDLAYKGLTIKNVSIVIPDKKPKNKELTEEQKTSNKQKSKIRVSIEHAISGVKRLHILKHKLRMKKYQQHNLVMLLGCGLHNFRCANRKNQTK